MIAVLVDSVESCIRWLVIAAAAFALPVGCARVGLQSALLLLMHKPPPRRALQFPDAEMAFGQAWLLCPP
jgi:hypothetical protein